MCSSDLNTATVLASGAALIGGATSLVGFLVPARAVNVSGSVGFIQDQTFYLTLAVAALSVMVAGAQMAWTQRAEPARDLLKGLLTLAVVTASGVTILNVLVAGTTARVSRFFSRSRAGSARWVQAIWAPAIITLSAATARVR